MTAALGSWLELRSSGGRGAAVVEEVICSDVLLPAEVRLVRATLRELLGEIPLERTEDEEALRKKTCEDRVAAGVSVEFKLHWQQERQTQVSPAE